MQFLHGGDLIARQLAAQGVNAIYGLCGGHVAPIFNGCVDNDIAIIDVRHEQAAGHAADAHARLTRNIGVAVVTAGPGVTDAVTAVANAYYARSPMLLIGGAAPLNTKGKGALQEMPQTGIPVYTNGGGRGTLSMTHPHCFKLTRSKALKEADLALIIGTPLDFRLRYGEGWNPNIELIQIENDAAELNHNREAKVAMVANSRLVLEALAEGLQGIRYDNWLADVTSMEQAKRDTQAEWEALDDAPVNHFRFGAEVNQFIDEDTIVIGDGGDIVSASAKSIAVTKPGRWLDPGPLGCLGVGAPFALAAQFLHPDKKVLIINGDGSFGFNGFEFETAVRFKLPIVSIVGNDAAWGQIRNPIIKMMGSAPGSKLAHTRYDEVVAALGGYGELVESPEEIGPALKRAFASGKPACINVMLDPDGLEKTSASTPYIM